MIIVILEQKKGEVKMVEAKLYFRYGVMSSGKTYDLIKNYYSHKGDGKEVVIMKPSSDTKGENTIVARNGQSIKVDFLVNDKDNVYLIISEYLMNNNLDYILVDEAQFLKEKQVKELFEITKIYDIPVICYGIPKDFREEFFPGAISLMAQADIREELTKTCSCGRTAICNIRFDSNNEPVFEGEQVAIDGEDYTYKSMCRRCANTLKKTKKRVK